MDRRYAGGRKWAGLEFCGNMSVNVGPSSMHGACISYHKLSKFVPSCVSDQSLCRMSRCETERQ